MQNEAKLLAQLKLDDSKELAYKTLIKRYKENLPTNISAIKNYAVNKNEDNLLNLGNTNSKNLYLLLLEDL